MKAIELLSDQFNHHISLVEKRPGVQQVYAPLFHEDGDMVEMFLDVPKDAELKEGQTIRISDHGLTLMRLSYTFDIDTPNKERIFRRILAENNIQENDGELFYETTPDSLYPALLHFAQAVAKVCSMRLYKREVLSSLFEEMLDDFIASELSKYRPEKSVIPVPERDDLEVDWRLTPNGIPVFVFGIKDGAKARLATIACLEFQRKKLPFKSLAVHEDFDKLPKKDRTRLTNACDKQFTSLDEFRDHIAEYLERESHQTN
jgi:uncharacterized protein DUF1828